MRFTLVHGGMHGAWCWELLVPELESLGHSVKTVDLPGHGTRRGETSTLAGYRQAVVDVLEPGDILVGHSMGCPVATMAADAFIDVAHIVYLAGRLPAEGRPMSYDTGGERRADGSVTRMSRLGTADRYMHLSEDGHEFIYDYDGAVAVFYQDCPAELAAWAYSKLTPQSLDVMFGEPISIPRFWEADLPRSFIRCTDDRAYPRELLDRQIERLGVRPLEITGSHSPFLSRPADLAKLLVEATATRPIAGMERYDLDPPE
jgi:pimeloyl-ACP methyl ester carboxylesterase